MSQPKKRNVSELFDHIGYWMRMISNEVSYSFAGKLEATGVTVAEWVILREMYKKDGVTSPSHIAEVTGLTRGAISKLMSRLIDKKLVHRKESSDDRRWQEIELSEKAIQLVPKLASLADANDETFFSVLNRKERSDLLEILKKLAREHEVKTVPME